MAKTNEPGDQNPFTYMMDQVLDSWVRQLMFTLPGRIVSFDSETQIAQVEAGIQRVVQGTGMTIPVIEGVPVCFPGDGEYFFLHQITDGETEGLLHFSQRAIDTWVDQGGPIPPHDLRVLSESDCFFEPGYRSRPGAITGFRNDGAGVGNYAGDQFLHLKSSGDAEFETPGNLDATVGGSATVDVTSDVTATVGGNVTATVGGDMTATVTGTAEVEAPTINLIGTVNITGALNLTGPLSTTSGGQGEGGEMQGTFEVVGGDVIADGVSLKTHTHPGDSGGTTGSPN